MEDGKLTAGLKQVQNYEEQITDLNKSIVDKTVELETRKR